MTDLDTAAAECLYRLYYRCWDACQDPDDPYGRSPGHQCHSVIPYKITKATAKRIYFTDWRGRRYILDRDKFGADGSAYHKGVGARLHLTPPELPTRPKPKTTTRPKPKTISELRREMADAHPDRGGTREAFETARARYLTARRAAS